MSGYETFTTREMVREARRLGLGVIVWSVSSIPLLTPESRRLLNQTCANFRLIVST